MKPALMEKLLVVGIPLLNFHFRPMTWALGAMMELMLLTAIWVLVVNGYLLQALLQQLRLPLRQQLHQLRALLRRLLHLPPRQLQLPLQQNLPPTQLQQPGRRL